MSEPWDPNVFDVPDLAWQTGAPPVRHPVPARYVPGLDAGDEVTIGLPGQYFIDGQMVTRSERQRKVLAGQADEQEALAVAAPFSFWLARVFPQAGLTMQWWPVGFTWVYRDAVRPGERRPDGVPPADDGPASWLDHVRPSLLEPPVRHPHPAREAEALTGRTVRLQHDRGAWSWWVGVGEPVDHEGDFVVHLMRPRDYWLAQVVFEPDQHVLVVPLHRLWVYD
jgi:hypothetical protein